MNKYSKIVFTFYFLLLSNLVFVNVHASTVDISFSRITSNNAENIAAQLSAQALDQSSADSVWGQTIASDEVLFTFNNNVGITSNVHEIYFDDGTFLSQTSLINSLGGFTNYTGGTPTPGNLPGANNINPAFDATASFGADTSGNPSNGLNASEDYLGIVIKLLPNLGFSDVQNALSNGDLRLGLHIGSIGSAGGSDSFVSNPVNPVPLPAAVWLLGTALLGLVGFKRKQAHLA